jgi:hypothetical protein
MTDREGQVAGDTPADPGAASPWRPTSVGFVGVVVYRPNARDAARFHATWHQTAGSDGRVGTGVGRGDLSSGFAGTHEITYYFADGSLAGGPLVLDVVPVGEAFELSWSLNGTTVAFGIGIDVGGQLVASYWRAV